VDQGSFVWEKPFAIQSHEFLSHTKDLRERHQKIFRAKLQVRNPPTGTKSRQLAKSQNGS
jgi:hypothetical protein